MTENKRFTYMEQLNGFCDVYDKGKILSCMRLEYVENTINLLNELNDECEFLKIDNEALEEGATKYAELCHKSLNENEELRTRNNAYIQDIEVFKEENTHLKLENEELKQFKEDVFNKIDMHLRMLPTARDNEFNEDDGDPSLYTGAIYMLETLKKELK